MPLMSILNLIVECALNFNASRLMVLEDSLVFVGRCLMAKVFITLSIYEKYGDY